MGRIDLATALGNTRDRIATSADSTADASLPGGAARPAAGPKCARLSRKEVKLRAYQYDDLSRLARQLMQQRHVKGERLTENTLVRVAIDLLLDRRAQLRGDTEEELLATMRRELRIPEAPTSRTPTLPNTGTSDLPDSRTVDVPRPDVAQTAPGLHGGA